MIHTDIRHKVAYNICSNKIKNRKALCETYFAQQDYETVQEYEKSIRKWDKIFKLISGDCCSLEEYEKSIT